MTADPTNPRPQSAQTREPDEHIDKHDDHDVVGLHAPIVRELAEPKDGYEPIPIWFAGIFGVIVFWSGFYAATYSGNFSLDRLEGDFRPLGKPVEKKAARSRRARRASLRRARLRLLSSSHRQRRPRPISPVERLRMGRRPARSDRSHSFAWTSRPRQSRRLHVQRQHAQFRCKDERRADRGRPYLHSSRMGE